MVISSRTPEGRSNHCPVCDTHINIDPSDPPGDAPCPRCGYLLWFTWEDRGDVQVIKPAENHLDRESLASLIDSVALRPGVRLVIDFSDVRHISSAGLAELIKLKRKLGGVRARVGFENVHPDLVEVFRLTRLDRVFDLTP